MISEEKCVKGGDETGMTQREKETKQGQKNKERGRGKTKQAIRKRQTEEKIYMEGRKNTKDAIERQEQEKGKKIREKMRKD